jgi:hypothetical protein
MCMGIGMVATTHAGVACVQRVVCSRAVPTWLVGRVDCLSVGCLSVDLLVCGRATCSRGTSVRQHYASICVEVPVSGAV